MTSAAENTTYAVYPARLAWGQWCHKTDRQIGRGDIHASYSADRIGMNQPIRQPFPWKGSLWVSKAVTPSAPRGGRTRVGHSHLEGSL